MITRKITGLILTALFLCSFGVWAQKSYIGNWDGGTATGSGSEPTNFGWSSTTTGNPVFWNVANGSEMTSGTAKSSGTRYVDCNDLGAAPNGYTNYYFPGKIAEDPEANRFQSNRILWMRWGDGGFTKGSSYLYRLKEMITPGVYTFSWKFAYHNNDNSLAPHTITVYFCKNSDGTGIVASKDFQTYPDNQRQILKEGSFTFDVCGDADYLAIKCNTGPMIGITDLSLKEASEDEIEVALDVSKSSLSFIDIPTMKESSFVVNGTVFEPVTITAPEGIILSQNTIELEDILCGQRPNITVTYTGGVVLNNDSIIITCGDIRKKITVNARPVTSNNLIQYWDGDGATGTGSEANNFGWAGTGVTSWQQANSTTPGIRYMDNPANYTYLSGGPFAGRVLYIRWDGVGGNASTVYSYPVELKKGYNYTFQGYCAWNSVATGNGKATFGIGLNTLPDATGASVAHQDVIIEDVDPRMVLHEMFFDIQVPEDGLYYLTISNDKAILGAVAGLSIMDVNAPVMNSSVKAFQFVGNSQETSIAKTFTVTGSNLTENVTLTAPKGITLSQTSLTPAEVKAGIEVTATYDGEIGIPSGTIKLASGSILVNISLTATRTIAMDPDKLYYIIHSSGNRLGVVGDSEVRIAEPVESDNYQVFRFIPTDNDIYYIQQVASDAYLAKSSASEWSMVWDYELVDERTQFIVSLYDQEYVTIKCLAKTNMGTDAVTSGSLVYINKGTNDAKYYWKVRSTDESGIETVAAGKSGFIVYPSVTNGTLNINAVEGTKISIYNIAGGKVLETPLKNPLNVGALSPGMYIIRTESGERAKFIKK